jgi:phosphoglycolate phosphatase-like HAD superfamily hydrolase
METMIFFDINGTLIARDERTDIPYALAVDELLGRSNAMKGIDTSARSDRDVLLEVLHRFRVPYDGTLWETFLGLYGQKLEEYRHTDVWRPNVDALEFVAFLRELPVQLGLISGELQIGARYKLEKIGIWDHFSIGGFGEDGLRRFDIAEMALKKAEQLHAKRFQQVYIIGDTVQDIKTARHLGAKAIAIATGSNSRQDLAAQKPEFLIERFSELMESGRPFRKEPDLPAVSEEEGQ